MKPKIINLFTRLGAGGPPRQALHLVRDLPAYGFNSVLAAGRCEPGEADMFYLLDHAKQVVDIPSLGRSVSLLRDLMALLELYQLFRKERPDIVHTHTAKAGVLGRLAAKAAGVPAIVHTFHGNVLDGYFSKPASKLIELVERILSRITDRICVLSAQQKENLIRSHRIGDVSRVAIIPLGMDLDEFASLPSKQYRGELVIGWLGRLVPVKDIPLLCDIIRGVSGRMENVRFIVAGDGPQRGLVKQLAADVGDHRLRFVGWQQDVRPVIEECHLLMQTSKNEGTPVALIQGMAAGRPFISTPAGGVVDMATGEERGQPNGARWRGNAVLLPPCAEVFLEVIADIQRRPDVLASMGELARENAKAYALSRFMTEIKNLYEGILRTPITPAGASLPSVTKPAAVLLNGRITRTP